MQDKSNLNNDKIIKQKDFVIISSIDWSEIWQMPQQLASSLVKSGHNVLFVENTGVRSPRFADATRISSRIKNWLIGVRGFSSVTNGLTVFSPLFIPLPYSKIALIINRFLLYREISKWMKSAKFYNPVVISFLPTPLVESLAMDLDPVALIYYCANDMAGGSVDAAPLRYFENSFMGNVNAVFCNSHALLDRANKFSKSTFLYPAGVDYEKFKNAHNDSVPSDLKILHGPIAGYVGAISAVFDQKLLVSVAQNLPGINFVLIGPAYVDVSLLNACKNIILMGTRSHDQIPAYIKGFNVALIPYIKNAFTDAVYSCKLNEYLAMGSTVIATNLNEIIFFKEKYGDVIKIAANNEEFEKQILASLEGSTEEERSARINVAKNNSWEMRFKDMYSTILKIIVSIEGRNDWRESLSRRHKASRKKVMYLCLLACASYFLLFYSPLMWLMGSLLTPLEAPKKVDAIVVFSGDGETNYINQSYQKRTLDAINYFHSGYAPLIVLSSGRNNTFSDVEIIKSLLINRGVPVKSIEILPDYPSSTFKNVEMVKEILVRHKAKSIILITSPYHSRRSVLVWGKVAPELEVITPRVVDTPESGAQWHATWSQIKVICYEYLAIIYYWSKGWF